MAIMLISFAALLIGGWFILSILFAFISITSKTLDKMSKPMGGQSVRTREQKQLIVAIEGTPLWKKVVAGIGLFFVLLLLVSYLILLVV